jgi:hypothetical protein
MGIISGRLPAARDGLCRAASRNDESRGNPPLFIPH